MLLFSLLTMAYSAEECPVTLWDSTSDWVSIADVIASEKASEIQALEEYIFTLQGEDVERLGIRTDGFIILQHGQILYEQYGRGFDANHKHLLWSVTKSINSALMGRAVYEGLLDIDASICDYYAEVPSENCDITSKHLASFASGLDWMETYEGLSNQVSSVLAMLYGVGSQDMASFVAGHPALYAPGEMVSYSTGDATLLSAVIKSAVQKDFGDMYPWTMLFDPLGVSATVERDQTGTFVGGSYSYMTPRDMAKFGAFYLNDGCIDGERFLPDGWVEASTSPSVFFEDCCTVDPSGWSWWLNTGEPTPYPDVPSDLYYAAGHWGQYIFVIPSWDVIIVRTGDDRDGSRDNNTMLSLALQIATAPSEEIQ